MAYFKSSVINSHDVRPFDTEIYVPRGGRQRVVTYFTSSFRWFTDQLFAPWDKAQQSHPCLLSEGTVPACTFQNAGSEFQGRSPKDSEYWNACGLQNTTAKRGPSNSDRCHSAPKSDS